MSRFDVINAERLVSSIDNRFAVHNIYNGLEDAMADLAGAIDNHVPHGARSHQRSLDQMHVALENRRPACLDDALNRDLAELASIFERTRRKRSLLSCDPSCRSSCRAFAAIGDFMSAD